MFRRLPETSERIVLQVDGRSVEARAGDTVAAALLAAGIVNTRVAAQPGAPAGPYCGTGACFECLVAIDGVGSRRACMVEAAPDMVIHTQGPRRGLAR